MSLAFVQVQDLIQARGGYPPAYDPWWNNREWMVKSQEP